MPPQDLEAEQSVLGGMMLSKDAIADVVEVLKGHDFYRPAHATVYEAILDLYAKGEPADPITVTAELTRRGEISRVGGPGYVHSLVQTVPTAANAEYYAEIVHERAVLRRLVEAGTRITQMGYAADGDVDDIVNSAQAEIYSVTEQRTSEDYLPLGDIMEGALDEIEAIGSRSGQMTGVPTGFTDLDSLTNGLHPGQMIVIAARPAMGKALALDTPLPTPAGWTTMGEVRGGDLLLDASGRPTRVTAVTDVLYDRRCYKITFDDGATVIADAEHQWPITTRSARDFRGGQGTWASVRTTREIAGTVRRGASAGAPHHSVANAAPLELPERDLPVGPYTLGAWLGGGRGHASRIDPARTTAPDPELLAHIEAEGFGARSAGTRRAGHVLRPAVDEAGAQPPGAGSRRAAGLAALLREAGVVDGEHIPGPYLRASVGQRRALLAGLLDANGTVTGGGSVRFTVTSRALAEGFRELVTSLGYRCDRSVRRAGGRSESASVRHITTFTTDDEVFRLERKRLQHKERRSFAPTVPGPGQRFIRDVTPVASVPVRCVEVDNPRHLYLATRSMVPTHNSTLALDFARACSVRHSMPSVIFSLEMGRNEIAMRLLSAEARVALHHMRSGSMTDEDWTRLARQMPQVTEAPLYIDDSPNLSMMEIRAKCRRLKQRNDLKLVVIDYLQLMQTGSSRRPESRQQEVSEMSRNLKLLAKELEVPVIALSQLNRGPEQRTDKKPMVSDLRESGCMTADTTLLRADTGVPVTFAELMKDGHEGVLVWSLDEERRLVRAPVTNVFSSGVKPVYRLRLASGREVKATGNHPFLTFGGWTPLEDLAVGDRIAVPRRTPEPLGTGLGWSEHRLGLLAHLIGDGCVLREQPVHYTSDDEANLDFVEAAARAEFGITPRRTPQKSWWHSYLPAPYRCTHGRYNPLHVWFRELGIEGLRSHEKRIPEELYSATDEEVAVFLRHLWATDGSVWMSKPGSRGAARIYYATSSRLLADGVVRLLSRFGIVARTNQVSKKGYERPGYHVTVSGGPDMLTFCRRIGVHGRRGERAELLEAELRERKVNTNVDSLPLESWELVKAERVRAGLTERQFQAALGMRYCGSALYDSCPSRARMSRCADVLDSEKLRAVADDDVFWDRIVAVDPLGEQPVYDATVKGTHNFVADGIAAHNSIEQDADMVVLLHREDAYEKESPRAGEADLIVAKHRNGPTATITVAFQGHYSRFVDMAQT
ncbi:replicative DNA helicase [Streptomyces marispadix]|uniref:replicative DNA helicase n=1 Tax=Streptomyces marispadix TaxID=2922868 RepID=UPI0027E26D80|nr:replicative DNA helicase [Streptomyces marispadix]